MADAEQKVEEEAAGMDSTPDDFFDPNLYAGDSILGILNVPARWTFFQSDRLPPWRPRRARGGLPLADCFSAVPDGGY